jgi:hypothetical protein
MMILRTLKTKESILNEKKWAKAYYQELEHIEKFKMDSERETDKSLRSLIKFEIKKCLEKKKNPAVYLHDSQTNNVAQATNFYSDDDENETY